MKSNELGSLEAIGIIITIIIAHIIIYLPERIINEMGPASILNIMYVALIVLILTFIILKLFKNFGNLDILDVADFLGGPLLKKTLSLLFVGYCIFLSGLFIRDFSESLKIVYFHDFNISIIILIFLVGSFIVNKFGFRKVVVCNFMILPTIIISIIIVGIASIPKFTYQRVFPILGYGANQTFLFGLTNISAFSDFIILYYLIPLLKNKKSFNKVAFVSMGLSALFLICSVAILLLVSNYSTSQSALSIYLATRRISFGSFLQRPDSLFILIWILSMFSYLSLIICLSNYVFNKGKQNSSVLSLIVVSALIWIFSILPQNIAQLRFLENKVLKYVSLAFVFGFNFIILVLGNVKLKLKQNKKIKHRINTI